MSERIRADKNLLNSAEEECVGESRENNDEGVRQPSAALSWSHQPSLPRQRTPQIASQRNSTRTGGSSMTRYNGSCSGERATRAKRTPVGRIYPFAPHAKGCSAAFASIAARSIKMLSLTSRCSSTIMTRSSRNEAAKLGRCQNVP